MSDRTPIFFTSDLHIGHANSIEFDNRPFRDLDHMHRVLINNYNSTVPENGVCYFLGDMGLCKTSILKDVISQLNGTKIFIMGNHDKGAQAMYNMGFDVVLFGAALNVCGQRLTLSHCPLQGITRERTKGMKGIAKGEHWHGESRRKHQNCSFANEGQFHLSGHIHSPNGGKSTRILHRQFDIGVVANKYRPVSISEIESWVAKTVKKEAEWKNVVGFPEYKVNYFGQIKSFKRYKNGKILSPYTDKDGYRCVRLRVLGGAKTEKVHRVVAKAFIENPQNLPQINHKNGLKFDNTMPNLEWSSNIDNQRHAWDNDLKTIKLTTDDVRAIKKRLATGESNTLIAKDFNVDQTLISNIKTGKIWKRVTV